ncbi:hypothetical protein BU26DRAFT_117539 [Trematosphaeria pertusa]|uniref:Uncharacterized protein n=1 Tax=Trematosphaeria pertusa TaxID=390896 RepID=A0A6A6I0C1_9PLEO|nr:uncharacterized protein BU26DRAFT_117539 [Trematosphaeria pertusa]KAF2243422.1 hypothetical protein BU26DRAFT_117539 [Trematosphaeria pertusa]
MDSRSRLINDLVHADVIRYVRNLDNRSGNKTPDFDYILSLFLGMIRHDQLDSFVVRRDIRLANFHQLLRDQGNLKTLVVALPFTGLPTMTSSSHWLSERSGWLTSRLASLDDLRLRFPTRQDEYTQAIDLAALLLNSAQKVHELLLAGAEPALSGKGCSLLSKASHILGSPQSSNSRT